MLILTEADYIGGNKAYKQRLAKFYKVHKTLKCTVICVRTELSSKDFFGVQNFTVIELGLSIIPISDLEGQLPQLLYQLIATEPVKKKVNPFKFGLAKKTGVSLEDRDLVRSLQKVPGLGDKKARTILNNFPSIKEIAEAKEEDLAKVVGPASARSVYHFFKKPRC